MAVLGVPYREATKRNMPRRWFTRSPHTHVALDDAIERTGHLQHGGPVRVDDRPLARRAAIVASSTRFQAAQSAPFSPRVTTTRTIRRPCGSRGG